MKDYKITFTLFTFKQSEIVTAETIWKAQDIIREKYGKDNVKISTAASMENEWCY